jgi:hypothetical protein
MVFLTYIYVRYKICIKLHFFSYLISKFCKLRPKIFFAKNVHTGNCVFYWAVLLQHNVMLIASTLQSVLSRYSLTNSEATDDGSYS